MGTKWSRWDARFFRMMTGGPITTSTELQEELDDAYLESLVEQQEQPELDDDLEDDLVHLAQLEPVIRPEFKERLQSRVVAEFEKHHKKP